MSRLQGETIALVGSTISCQGGTAEIGEDVGIPHVQSSAIAMSRVREMDLGMIMEDEGMR